MLRNCSSNFQHWFAGTRLALVWLEHTEAIVWWPKHKTIPGIPKTCVNSRAPPTRHCMPMGTLYPLLYTLLCHLWNHLFRLCNHPLLSVLASYSIDCLSLIFKLFTSPGIFQIFECAILFFVCYRLFLEGRRQESQQEQPRKTQHKPCRTMDKWQRCSL